MDISVIPFKVLQLKKSFLKENQLIISEHITYILYVLRKKEILRL